MFILTGGPCAGKTTLLERLGALGFTVVREAATEILREEGSRVRRDPLEFQRKILMRQLRNEHRALSDPARAQAIFVDRGVGDHFGYLRIDGLEPFQELDEAWEMVRSRYGAMFFLELNPAYQRSSRRSEPEARARRIHQVLREEYLRRHPRVISVPWLPVEERVEQVLRDAGLARGVL